MRPLVLSLQQFSVHWEPYENGIGSLPDGLDTYRRTETGRLGRIPASLCFRQHRRLRSVLGIGGVEVECNRYGLRKRATNQDPPAILPVGQISSKSCPVPSQKIFRLTRRANHL